MPDDTQERVPMVIRILSVIAEYFGMRLVKDDELQRLKEENSRLREATGEVARDMFVIIATGGPKRGMYMPVPVFHTNAIPPADHRPTPNRYTTPAPWQPYQEFIETIVPADRREVSGLVVPKSTAISLGYTLDTDPGERTHRP